MALNASYNDARAKYALFSEPFYSLTPSVIFLKNKYKDATKMVNADELAKRKMCGLRGYNYADFGVDVSAIDTDSRDFTAVFQKLRAGGCDVILARIEVLEGFAKVGDNYLTEDVGHSYITGAKKSQFHMLISRKSKNMRALEAAINRGIGKLKASGKLKEMLDRYLQ
jgi:polar amino acid transport system substrate-binding protein